MNVHTHRTDPARFWRWFLSAETRFRNLEVPEREALLDELLGHIQAYCPDLYFEAGGAPGGPNELIVTASGNEAAFPCVRAVVAAAPPVSTWQVIAFKPAQGFEFTTQHNSVVLDPRKCWFLVDAERSKEQRLWLRVACPRFKSILAEDYAFAIWTALDTGLGELMVAERILEIQACELPPHPQLRGFRRLTELPAILER